MTETLHPIQILEANLADLADSDKAFALSLIAGFVKYKKLSEKQLYWVNKLVDRALGKEKKPEPKVESVGSFDGVLALFNKAKAHLKYPKIVLATEGGEVQLSVAGPASKVPGTVNVTDGRPYGMNVWYGRVAPSGEWTQSPKVSEESLKPVRRLLQGLASDPAGTAKKYATLTGRCCFCNAKLTDEHSTAAGFGRTCAKNWGLEAEWKAATKVLD